MVPETRVDKFINKLAELTVDDRIPWEVDQDKLGLVKSFYCEVPGGKIELITAPQTERCIRITLENEDSDYFFSPFLDDLIRAVKEFVRTPWSLNQFMDDIIEGALEK